MFGKFLSFHLYGSNNVSSITMIHNSLGENFSRRELTRSSDKLPALAGTSHRLHGLLGGHYLAGLWSASLEYGLLWRIDESRTRMSRGRPKRAASYRAPSLSWAALDEAVCCPYPPKKNPACKLQLIESHIALSDPTNPYGAVRSGHLKVRGKVASI
jgi:hypothetical protein